MGKLVLPGVWKTMAMWADAYTATLDASTDAAMNPEISNEVMDSLKHAKSRALQTGAKHDIAVAQNQQIIADQMKKFSPAHLAELMKVWMPAKREIVAASWDLNQPVQFHEEQIVDRPIRFWQGENPLKDFIILPRTQAALVIKFLRFVEANSPNFDPREYTKAMLMKQGITKENFSQHSDKLGITNPWDPIP